MGRQPFNFGLATSIFVLVAVQLLVGCIEGGISANFQRGAISKLPFAITEPAVRSNSSSPTVRWSSASESYRYKLIVSKNEDCTGSTQQYSDLTTKELKINSLENGIYYACLSTVHPNGATAAVAENSPYRFEIKKIELGDFIFTSPIRVPVVTPSVTVTWTSSAYAEAYLLVLSTKTDCSVKLQEFASLTGLTKVLPPLNSGTYYVCLSAFDSYGNKREITKRIDIRHQIVWGQPDEYSDLNARNAVAGNGDIFTVGDKMFLVGVNSVRVWNSIPSGPSISPDFILGKPNADSYVQPLVPSANRMSQPRSACFNGTKFAVSDSGWNRILIYNSFPTKWDQPADLVLGQPDFGSLTVNNGGVSASSLYAPSFLYCDGTSLFVVDAGNNRVLGWSSMPTSNGQAADIVIGQSSFSGNTANSGGISASTLNAPSGVTGDGVKIFICDGGNHRVIGFNSKPTGAGSSAPIVLGQPNLVTGTANNAGGGYGGFTAPSGCKYNNGKLLVADYNASRYVIWNGSPVGINSLADFILGGSTLDPYSFNTLNYTFVPTTGHFDGTRFYGLTTGNMQLLLIWNSFPATSTQNADRWMGKPAVQSANTGRGAAPGPLQTDFPAQIMMCGNRLYLGDGFYRILRFDSAPKSNATAPDGVFGQPNFQSGYRQDSVFWTYGTAPTFQLTLPACDAKRLYGTSRFPGKIVVYNNLPTSPLQTPDLTLNSATIGSAFGNTLYPFSDGTRLFVGDFSYNRVLIWNSPPSANDQSADVVLGQPTLLDTTANNGGISAKTLSGVIGAPFSNGKVLIVSDFRNNRVLIWNSIPTSNFQPADVVVGQPDFTSNSVNTSGISARSLNAPRGVFFDGKRLLVADSGNNRVLVWNSLPTKNSQEADWVIGQNDFVSGDANMGNALSIKSLYLPSSLASDGIDYYIADSGNDRIVTYPVPID